MGLNYRQLQKQTSEDLPQEIIFTRKSSKTEIILLPPAGNEILQSSGISIDCFNNFILSVCKYLFENRQVTIDGITIQKFDVMIVLPKRLQQDMMAKAKLYYRENAFKSYNLAPSGNKPLETIILLAKEDEGILLNADLPTKLSALFDAIVLYLKVDVLVPQ